MVGGRLLCVFGLPAELAVRSETLLRVASAFALHLCDDFSNPLVQCGLRRDDTNVFIGCLHLDKGIIAQYGKDLGRPAPRAAGKQNARANNEQHDVSILYFFSFVRFSSIPAVAAVDQLDNRKEVRLQTTTPARELLPQPKERRNHLQSASREHRSAE